MSNELLKKEISLEMIPQKYRDITKIIGIEKMYELCKECGGSMIYIPKIDKLTRNIIYKKVKEEFNGSNYKKLALKYDLCESTVRKIVG